MAKQNFHYDHPVYTVHLPLTGSVTGSAGGVRFGAFATSRCMSVTIRPTTAGTSNDVSNLYAIEGTTTATLATTTFGSAATTGTNIATTNTQTVSTLGHWSFVKGTDATAVYQVTLEVRIQQGVDVEAPL